MAGALAGMFIGAQTLGYLLVAMGAYLVLELPGRIMREIHRRGYSIRRQDARWFHDTLVNLIIVSEMMLGVLADLMGKPSAAIYVIVTGSVMIMILFRLGAIRVQF